MSEVERVEYFPPNDLAFLPNCRHAEKLLSSGFIDRADSVVDAVELYQSFLLIQDGERLDGWDEASHRTAMAIANKAKGTAFCLIRNAISKEGFRKVLEEAEENYIYGNRIWELIGGCKAFESIDSNEFYDAVSGNLSRTRSACSVAWPSKAFPKQLRDALVANAELASALLVEKYSSEPMHDHGIYLPSSFTVLDANAVLKEYLASDGANLNYVNAIVAWPSSCEVKLDAETIVLARRVQEKLNDVLFGDGSGLCFGVGVALDPEQDECVLLSFDGAFVHYSYSASWLMQTLDNPSILSNLAFVFDILNIDRVLPFSTNGEFESAFMRMLMRPRASYRRNIELHLEEKRLLACLKRYRDFLESKGILLESVIEWYFNEYVPEVFGIGGFTINMPSRATGYIEKCKVIGPEIEKALKVFAVFKKHGHIDPRYYEVETFGGFENVPSLVQDKYVRGVGDVFENETAILFSDQSILSIATNPGDDGCFANKALSSNVREADIAEFGLPSLTYLKDQHCVIEGSDGCLKLTAKAVALKKIWHHGSYPLAAMPRMEGVFRGMASSGEAEFYSALFTKEEADYLNYVFNRRAFSDSLGLRDKWVHGGKLDVAENDPEPAHDYHMLLLVMVCVLLKINEELVMHSGVDLEPMLVDCVYQRAAIGDTVVGV